MMEWIFFDVGNVLFNDDQQAYFSYRFIHREIQQLRPDYTFEQMLREREAFGQEGNHWILHLIARQFLSEEQIHSSFEELRRQLLPLYDEFHLPNPGLEPTLAELRERGYRLGIIANQTPECRESLHRRDLMKWFEVIAISEELNLFKPNEAFYSWAIRRAGCEPGASVMIGDRTDNDIVPAQSLGMRTLYLDWPHYDRKLWQPTDPQARQFLESCQRVPLFGFAAHSSEVQADRVITDLAEIPAAVESLQE